MKIRHWLMNIAGGGKAAVAEADAVVSVMLAAGFDAEATVRALREAAEAVEGGDGNKAIDRAAEAFARLALFHRPSR